MSIRVVLFAAVVVILFAGLAAGVVLIAFARRRGLSRSARLRTVAAGLLMVAVAAWSLWGVWHARLNWLGE